MINLCYKEYEYKLNLAACKSFYEQTGKDLAYTLMRYINACSATREMDTISRLTHYFEIETSSIMSIAFHCMIKQENKNIPLAEIQDAMFRVGWLPVEGDSEKCEPWPLVALAVATEITSYYSQIDKKKVGT